MASITITINEAGTTYQRVGGGYTGEVYEAPRRIQLPAPVAEAMGLSPWSFDGDGNCVEYTLLYPLMDEKIVHAAKAEAQEVAAQDEEMTISPEMRKERDNLTALRVAVQECGCQLRSGYVEMKYTATTKAAYRENEHRTATLIIYQAEGRKRRVA